MKPLLFFSCLFICSAVWCQGILSGKVFDSLSKKPLPFATATVFKGKDTSLVTYRLSDPEGKLRVPYLPFSIPLYVIVSYSGYEVYRKEFTLSSDAAELNLDTILMQPSSKTLEEVLVVAERPPVRVFRDTIEFNAASFKTLPTALVEDLLKKLPGVQVDQAGNITVNGKRVNRILVDGKFFFGNDPKIATRNLPADMIDKVQVLDDQQQIDRSANGDLTNIGKVINLTLKKGLKKGWFGKAYGGYGTQDRYEAGGIANIYRDTLQLSILGYSNNINRSGFTLQDVASLGGFERSGIQSLNIVRKNGNEGFSINGLSFGGLDEGIAQSNGAGLNLNHAPSRKFNLFGQYFFGHNHNNIHSINTTQQFTRDTAINTFTESTLPKNSQSHNVNVGMNMTPSDYTTISLQASGVFSKQQSSALSTIQTSNNKTGIVSRGNGTLRTHINNNYYGDNLAVTFKSKKKAGRIFNLLEAFNYQDNDRNYTTEAENIFFYPTSDTLLFNQLRSEQTPSRSLNAQLNLSEPLSSQWTLRFNNSYDFVKDDQNIDLFDKDPFTGAYIFLISNRNGLSREQNKFLSKLALAYNIKSLTVTISANGLWQNVRNSFKQSANEINFKTFDFLPGLSVFWKNLSFSYDKNVVVPAINYLNPGRIVQILFTSFMVISISVRQQETQ